MMKGLLKHFRLPYPINALKDFINMVKKQSIESFHISFWRELP